MISDRGSNTFDEDGNDKSKNDLMIESKDDEVQDKELKKVTVEFINLPSVAHKKKPYPKRENLLNLQEQPLSLNSSVSSNAGTIDSKLSEPSEYHINSHTNSQVSFPLNPCQLSKWRSDHGPIKVVNFDSSGKGFLKDQYDAYGCIVVLTSDQENAASLTHIGSDAIKKISIFVSELKGMIPKNSKIILAGGSPKTDSDNLRKEIFYHLKPFYESIFDVVRATKSYTAKHAVLFKDKVEVSEQTGAEKRKISIFFSDGHIEKSDGSENEKKPR